jgi:copper(I)-binding protein
MTPPIPRSVETTYVMLMALTQPLEADGSFPLTLTFENVRAAGTAAPMLGMHGPQPMEGSKT